MKNYLLLAATALFISSCGNDNNHADKKEHEAKTVESHQETHSPNAEPYAICTEHTGDRQSPINILTKTLESGSHKIVNNAGDEITAVENKGHTVQLDFAAGAGVVYDGVQYDRKQLHFHTPSEHLVDGMTFPLEMHVVHIKPGTENDEIPQYLVIGAMFKMGEENEFINEFLNDIPAEAHSAKTVEAGKIDFNDLAKTMPESARGHYYHYQGSLTTPPYTESVEWIVMKHVFEASPEQIEKLNAIEGNNARHIQSIKNRKIESL